MLLYANHVLQKSGSRYTVKTLNFIDFLAEIARTEPTFLVAAPTETEPDTTAAYSQIDISPERVIELPVYRGHGAALWATFRQAGKLRRAMVDHATTCGIAGPGPNSMLWLLSYTMPRSTRFAFFIRGNTAETLRHIYRRSIFRPIVMTLVGMFERRIRKLQRRGRAVVFAMGPELVDRYDIGVGRTHCILPLLQAGGILDAPPERSTDGTTRLLCLGRLSAEKNIDSLVRAVALLTRNDAKILLTIAGAGDQRSTLEHLVAHLGVQDHVTFVGFVPHGPEVHRLLDAHDRLVLCSLTEGVPRAVVEAFARWLPVIATRVGSLPRLFSDEIAWANDTSSAAIAEAIDQSLADPDRARTMTAQAHEQMDSFRVDLEAARIGLMLRDRATWDASL